MGIQCWDTLSWSGPARVMGESRLRPPEEAFGQRLKNRAVSCVGSRRCKRLVPDAASGLPFLGPGLPPVTSVCASAPMPLRCARESHAPHMPLTLAVPSDDCYQTCFCQEIFLPPKSYSEAQLNGSTETATEGDLHLLSPLSPSLAQVPRNQV